MQLLAERSAVAIRRVHAVVNPASGSVAPGAADALAALFAELGLEHRVIELAPDAPEAVVRAAVDAGPDLVVVLGGDGTARLVAESCGPQGPVVAPLSGGTMNKLGRALYGSKSWRDALTEAIANGEARWVPAGEVGGRAFFCGAMVGSPALMARAREALRARELGRAWRSAVVASRKALLSRLDYDLGGQTGQAVAISFLCPTVSRARADADDGTGALTAAVLEAPEGSVGMPTGVRWALSHLIGDWRDDPELTTPCVAAVARSRSAIPVMLDGEFFRLGRKVEIRFRPRAFRALAISAPEDDADLAAAAGFCD